MPRQKAASLTIQWRISQKTCDRLFLSNIFMGTSCVALSIKNIKTRASREMTSRKKWGGGGRCQALECGRARYLPSLIALLTIWNVILTCVCPIHVKTLFRIRVLVYGPTLVIIQNGMYNTMLC